MKVIEIVEEMRKVDRHNKAAILPILGRIVHINETYGSILVVTGFVGDDMEDTIACAAIWFYAQLVFSKMIITSMNGVMTATFDINAFQGDGA